MIIFQLIKLSLKLVLLLPCGSSFYCLLLELFSVNPRVVQFGQEIFSFVARSCASGQTSWNEKITALKLTGNTVVLTSACVLPS